MARYIRRLIKWLLAFLALQVLLALAVLVALRWYIDADDFRQQIEVRASTAIGRPVHLTGALRWELGRQIYIVSEGGEIANAAGFGPEPLARWSRLRLGVAARPLLDKRVLVDRIEVDGLELNLARSATGDNNWTLQMANAADGADSKLQLQVDAVAVRKAQVRYVDAASGGDWRVNELDFSAQLPADLEAASRTFRDVELSARAFGGLLPETGVPLAVQIPLLQLESSSLQTPAFEARWADATLHGLVSATHGDTPTAQVKIDLQAPSLRALLATAGFAAPPTTDPDVLGAMQLRATVHYANPATEVNDLSLTLDDTTLQGSVSLPRISPLALRFDLVADQVNVDRYLEPDTAAKEPFELPLATLRALDAKGVVRIRSATVAGAAVKELRIDVE